MSFFKNLFDFKRTRMIDEAVFFHRPVSIGKNILAFFAAYLIASLIVAVLQAIPLMAYIMSQPGVMDSVASGSTDALANAIDSIPAWVSGTELLFTVVFALTAIYYCKKYESRSLFTMGIFKEGCVPEYLVGFLIGISMVGVTLLLNFAVGTVEISYAGFSPIIILFFVGCLIKGFAESAFVHGYFTVSVARDYAPIIAIAAGTVAFSVFTLTAVMATVVTFLNSLLLGFFTGVYVFKRGSIIGVSAILSGWSFTQMSIFSSNADTSPIILTNITGSAFINGGSSGVGGGLFGTLVLVVAIFLLLLTPQKKSQISDFEKNAFRM